MRAHKLVLATLLFASLRPCLADGPTWRRDMWFPSAPPGSEGHYAAGIWVDAQGRVQVAVGVTPGAPRLAHAEFGSGLDFHYMNPVLGDVGDGISIAGDPATGDLALLRTKDLSIVLLDRGGEEKWRAAALPGSGLVSVNGGVALHPSGDIIAVAGTSELYAARFARGGGGIVWSQTHTVNAASIAKGGIAIDPSGDVIVASQDGSASLVLSRIDGASGALEASQAIAASACSGMSGFDVIGAVGTDFAGDVYVAGSGAAGGTGIDGFVMKTTSVFSPMWCQRQNDGTAATESWRAIAVDAGGEVALSGTRTASGARRLLAARLGAGGSIIWMQALPGADNAEGRAVAFDASGNVVAGGGDPQGGPSPLILANFDSGGGVAVDLRWRHEAQDNVLHGAAVDASGAMTAVGEQQGTVVVHRIGPSGWRTWSAVGGAGSAMRSVADAAGNVYVAGQTPTGAWLVQKYDAAGVLAWEDRGSRAVRTTDVALSPSGDLVAIGSGGDVVIYSPSGAVLGSGNAGIGGGSTDAPSIVVHGNGELTVAGPTIAHLSGSLGVIWRVMEPFQSVGATVNDLALDAQGFIYVAGSIGGDPALARYAPTNGAPIWIRSYPGSAPGDTFSSIGVEPAGHVMVVGALYGVNRIMRFHKSGSLFDYNLYDFPLSEDDAARGSSAVQVVVGATGAEAAIAVNFARSSRSASALLRWQLDPLSDPGPRRISAGEGPGLANTNLVRMFDAGGIADGSFTAYGAGRYGTNVAAGDVDAVAGDEQLTGPGPGSVFGPQVRAFTGAGASITKVNFFAYGTLRFGVNVGSGPVDLDPTQEIVTGPGPGTVFGPHVRGWNYDGAVLGTIPTINFFAYGTLRYGVNAHGAHLTGGERDEILTGPGPGTPFGPQVRAFVPTGSGVTALSSVNFVAFQSGNFGANVAGSDLDGDYYDEIMVGRGPGATLAAEVATFDFDGSAIQPKGPSILVDAATRYGVNVAGGDLENDSIGDLLTGVGDDPAGPARVRAFRWLPGGYTAVPSTDFHAYTPSAFGVNVAMADIV